MSGLPSEHTGFVVPELLTARLRLRAWRDEDREPFAALNCDPEVMRFFPAVLSREESDAFADRIRLHFDAHGFSLWAVEIPGTADFIGYVGLCHPTFNSHFTPCVEIGWRLARGYWGNGYATEAAQAALKLGFETLRLPEIVAFTATANDRSRRVMAKLGMHHDPREDFDHPSLPLDHPLRRHVLYRRESPTRTLFPVP